jgi:hypothetical protein
MANEEQLSILKQGVEVWNEWREMEPLERIDLIKADLRKVNLTGADLGEADLSEANLSEANLSDGDFRHANLYRANLGKAHISNANLSEAFLWDAEIYETNLRGANLRGTDLSGADLSGADLSEADLAYADLRRATLNAVSLRGANLTGTYLFQSDLIRANIEGAKISKSYVYGVNVWDLEGEFKEEQDLIITPPGQPLITVDNIKVAQFIYLILNYKAIRDVINTLTSKTVLILGRFAIPERKAILDALRDKLREYDLLPIVFDFDRPTDKDFTETIKTLAGLSYFVIADVTNPKSSPLELQATVPDYQIPFVPIIQEGEQPFAMMIDLQKKYNWVLDTLSYSSAETLIKALKPAIIEPAIQKHNELRLIKAREPKIRSANDFIDDKGLDNRSKSVES